MRRSWSLRSRSQTSCTVSPSKSRKIAANAPDVVASSPSRMPRYNSLLPHHEKLPRLCGVRRIGRQCDHSLEVGARQFDPIGALRADPESEKRRRGVGMALEVRVIRARGRFDLPGTLVKCTGEENGCIEVVVERDGAVGPYERVRGAVHAVQRERVVIRSGRTEQVVLVECDLLE